MEKRSNRKESILSILTGQLEPGTFLKRPYFPDLLRQPDLVIVPELGRFIAVYLYGLKQRPTWRSTLAAFEDLFELKLHLGPNSLAVGVNLNEDLGATGDTPEQNDMSLFLHHTFDLYLHPGLLKDSISGGEFVSNLSKAEVRRNLMPLWRSERERARAALRRFDEQQYAHLVDKNRKPQLKSGKGSVMYGEELARLGFLLQTDSLLTSIKSSIGSLERQYKLRFDFELGTDPPSVVQVMRSHRYGSREAIRYLMSKARLLHYEIHLDFVQLVPARAIPILLLDGNIAGPDHDPYRYLRSLLSVGWKILSTDWIARLPELLNADLQEGN